MGKPREAWAQRRLLGGRGVQLRPQGGREGGGSPRWNHWGGGTEGVVPVLQGCSELEPHAVACEERGSVLAE